MCGIAGIATRDGLRDGDPSLVDRMLVSLAHRGPDDQYMLGDDRAMLGTRRLAIIDLDGGRQPLTDESGLITASQNGEIYNYVELREDLLRRGHTLRTDGDTETIVHLYEDYGVDFVDHLRGMFAIAIWDGRNRRLVLARDRLGEKPLYWRLSDGRLTYGSELKAILEDETVERTVDRSALGLYLQYAYVPAPRTILEGVNKLPAATVLVWDGGTPTVSTYWSPSYEPKRRQTPEEDLEEGTALVREAVRLRLRSDVPVGVFLSGGMDSSVVTGMMAAESASPVRSFSIGFEDRSFDELPYARQVARHFSTIHTEEVVRLDAVELLPDLARHYDEPFGDSSAIPTFRVAQIAGAQLKVVLTGDGGDELFGGYLRYRAHPVLGALNTVPAPILQASARLGHALTGPLGKRSRFRRRLRTAEALFGLEPDQRYVRLMTLLNDDDRARLLGPSGNGSSAYLLGVLGAGPRDPIDRMLRADLLTYLPEDLLVKVDRATMASSLEARAPLLDHRLVEFAARLPVERKIDGGNLKALLRSIAKQLMPATFVDRPKMGFTMPLAEWFRGPLGDRYRDLVLASDSLSRDHLDPAVGDTLLREHTVADSDHNFQLWLLLMFELWARTWLKGPSVAASPGSRPSIVPAGRRETP
jgi:asparagine synthase (glutamine-hydrolysing)